MRMAEAGLGAAVLPEPAAAPEERKGRLKEVSVEGLFMENQVKAVWIREKALAGPASWFLNMIEKEQMFEKSLAFYSSMC